MGRRAPTRYLHGGRVLNVFTGEILDAGVAIFNDRIAYVGPDEPLLDQETIVEDVTGKILVPGYIEVHIHAFQLNTPAAFTHAIALRGTTTMVADTLQLLSLFGPSSLELLDSDLGAPVRTLWGLRVAPQTQPVAGGSEADRILRAFKMSEAELARMLDHPRVVQAFEWSSWAAVVRDGDLIPAVVAAALERSMRVDLHAPGASPRTLAALAAAGGSDCHESLTPEEVLNRIRLGLYAPLRYSALRPDLPELVAAVRATDGFERLLLTTDGAMPDFLADGLMDQVVRVAIDHGVRPEDAIRMATLHPAAYLGLDDHIGAVAVGRLADILVLPAIDHPVPERVYIGGEPINDQPVPTWRATSFPHPTRPFQRVPTPGEFRLRPEDFGVDVTATGQGNVQVPVIHLRNPVITQLTTAELPVREGFIDLSADPSLVQAVLFDEESGRYSKALIRGMGTLPGIATTYTCAYLPLVIGRDPHAMARSAQRLQQRGPGIYVDASDRELFSLPLPIAGIMSDLTPDELASRCRELQRLMADHGYAYHAPLYLLLFLTADHLPGPRLTAAGLWDVRPRQLIYPSLPREA